MDGVKVLARYWAGLGKAADKAGQVYAVYRFTDPLDAMNAGNLIDRVPCIFAFTPLMHTPAPYKQANRMLYADGSRLLPRDILVGPAGTFFVGDQQPLVPMQVVLCNDTIEVQRASYVGTVLQPQTIASGVPVFRQLKKLEQQSTAQIGVGGAAKTAVAEWLMFTPLPLDAVQQGDTVFDHLGRKCSIDAIDNTGLGPVLSARQSDVAPG